MRTIGVLSAALVVSLIWSYTTWTSDAEEVSDDVVYVYQASENDLQKVSWASKDLKVVVEKKKDAHGDYLWVATEETKKKVPTTKDKPPGHPGEDEEEPDAADEAAPEGADAPAEPAAEVPTEVKTMRFVASAQGMEMWKSFAPLAALRELSSAGADRTTFGFEGENAATVDIVAGSGAIALKIGGETYGSKDRYVEANGKTYLVDDATLRPLQFASSRLVERSLFPLGDADIERVDLALPGKALSWTHQNKDDAAKAFWAHPDAPDKKDDVGGTWLDKLFKLKLRDYVDESAAPAAPEAVATYTVHGKGEAWKVELLKAEVDGKTQWYARTDFNRVLVSLTDSLVRNVVDDLDELE